jgi:hypothetical protein
MKCFECGRHITPRSKFCPYCGKPVSSRRSPKAPLSAKKPNWPLYLTLVLAGIVMGVLAFRWLQKQEPASAATATNFDPTLRGEQLAKLYPQVYEVASQFNCPCGDCNDGVEVCDCEMARGAAEVRSFIYQLLQVHEPPHAIELVAQKYGSRKNGTAAQLQSEHIHPPSWQASPSKMPATSN